MVALLQTVYDVTGNNLPKIKVPAGVLLALYGTGSAGVPATPAQSAAHPGHVVLAQSPIASIDEAANADALDVETGAATLDDLKPWYLAAAAGYRAAKRPGQRYPAIYCSWNNRTNVANRLVSDGIHNGPGLWLARWNLTVQEAIAMLLESGGPFPVIGVQLFNAGLYDVSLMSVPWLEAVSRAPAPPPPPEQHAYAWINIPPSQAVTPHILTSDDGGKTFR